MSTRTSLPPDLVVEKLTAKTAPPPMFKVLLLNDDYTPMEFVVHVLEKFFGKSAEDAFRVMLQVHHEGKGGVRRLSLRYCLESRSAGRPARAGTTASAAMRTRTRRRCLGFKVRTLTRRRRLGFKVRTRTGRQSLGVK